MTLCDGAIIRDLLRRRKNAVAHMHVTREYMNGFLCFKQACRNAYFCNFLKSGIATCGCSSFGVGKKTGGIPSQRHHCMWFWSRPRRRHPLYTYGWRMAEPIFVKFGFGVMSLAGTAKSYLSCNRWYYLVGCSHLWGGMVIARHHLRPRHHPWPSAVVWLRHGFVSADCSSN